MSTVTTMNCCSNCTNISPSLYALDVAIHFTQNWTKILLSLDWHCCRRKIEIMNVVVVERFESRKKDNKDFWFGEILKNINICYFYISWNMHNIQFIIMHSFWERKLMTYKIQLSILLHVKFIFLWITLSVFCFCGPVWLGRFNSF